MKNDTNNVNYIIVQRLCFLSLSQVYLFNIKGATVVKNPPANAREAGDADSIPESRKAPERGNSNLLQHVYLENSMDGGAW